MALFRTLIEIDTGEGIIPKGVLLRGELDADATDVNTIVLLTYNSACWSYTYGPGWGQPDAKLVTITPEDKSYNYKVGFDAGYAAAIQAVTEALNHLIQIPTKGGKL